VRVEIGVVGLGKDVFEFWRLLSAERTEEHAEVLGEAVEGLGCVGGGREVRGHALGFARLQESFVVTRQGQFVLLCGELSLQSET
jgi:hypothetical protein